MEQRIDDLYDVERISKQFQAVDSLLSKTVEDIKAAKALSIDFNVNTKTIDDYNKKIAELQKVLANVQKSTDAAVKSSILLAKQKEAEAKATKAITQATEAESKAKERQAKASEIAANKAKLETSEYNKLSKAFLAAAKEAKDLGAQYGVLDKRAQAAAKRANELNDRLKAIDGSVGNFQRNVGNYKSAFDGIGKGIGGIATSLLAVVGITSLGSFFSDAVDEFLQMDKNVRLLQNTLRNQGIPEAFGRLEESSKKLAKQFGSLDDDDILKVFNQLIVYGKLSEDQINQLTPVIIDFAAATGQDLSSATSTLLKALEGNGKALKEYGINIKDAKTPTEAFKLIMTELAPKVKGVGQAFEESSAGGIAQAKQQFKDLKEEIGGGLLPILNSVLNALVNIAKYAYGAGKALKDALTTSKSFISSAVESSFEDDQKAQSAIEQTVRDNIGFAKGQVEQLKKLQAQGKKLQFTEADVYKDYLKNLQITQGRLDQAVKIAEKGQNIQNLKEALVNQQGNLKAIAALNEIIDPVKKITPTGDPNSGADKKEKGRDLVEADRQATFQALQDNLNLFKEFDLKRTEDEKLSYELRLKALQDFGVDSRALIEAQFEFESNKAGLTAKEREKIENDKNNALIRLASELNERLVKITAKSFNLDTEKVAAAVKGLTPGIAKEIEAAQKAFAELQKKTIDNAKELKKKISEKLLELSTELQGLFFDIFTNALEKQKNAIQDQIDLLELQKQKEIEVADQTITNAQEKADAIAVIEARAAARRQQLELKQRQLEQQKAKFEKAQNVATIVQNTAVAVVGALGAKPYGPQNIALAAIIGAIGAIQLARAIAQPIPKYAEGTENHPGGPMVVGDGGRSEAVVLPDGSIHRTPSTATLMSAPAGTMVFPDYAKAMNGMSSSRAPVVNVSAPDNSADLRKGFGQVVKAVKAIPQPILQSEGNWSRAMRVGSSQYHYLNKNL